MVDQNLKENTKERKADYGRLRYRIALQMISNFNIRGKHILDIGCGAGEFSSILKSRGGLPICLDINFHNIKRTKSFGIPAFVHNVNQGLSLKSESFDLAISLEVIEHIPHAEYHLSEIYRILKKDGYLILSTPNAAHYLFRLKTLFGHPPHQEGYHYRFFNKKNLDKLLDKMGFKIVKRNAVIYAFLYNRIKKLFNLPPIWLRLPTFLESLFARNFFLLVKKL